MICNKNIIINILSLYFNVQTHHHLKREMENMLCTRKYIKNKTRNKSNLSLLGVGGNDIR
jgi:hypothetical protein